MKRTFEESASPAYGIRYQSLALKEPRNIPDTEAIFSISVFGEHIVKLLRDKSSFCIVATAIATVFGFVDVDDVDAKKGVWNQGGRCWVRQVRVDNEDGQ
jgi:hypothetical protein